MELTRAAELLRRYGKIVPPERLFSPETEARLLARLRPGLGRSRKDSIHKDDPADSNDKRTPPGTDPRA